MEDRVDVLEAYVGDVRTVSKKVDEHCSGVDVISGMIGSTIEELEGMDVSYGEPFYEEVFGFFDSAQDAYDNIINALNSLEEIDMASVIEKSEALVKAVRGDED